MKVQKITNPLYVGELGSLLLRFYNKVKDASGMYQGITYESFYTYICQIVQFGGEKREFWIAIDNEPIGFAAWRVMNLPYVGKVYCDFIYNSIRNQKAAILLCKEFINFGKQHRAPLYGFGAINEVVGRHFVVVGKKLGIEFTNTGIVDFTGR